MKIYPFIYQVNTFDADFMDKMQAESGITFAHTFTEAMNKIEDYYGESICSVKYLVAMEEGEVLQLDNDIADSIID